MTAVCSTGEERRHAGATFLRAVRRDRGGGGVATLLGSDADQTGADRGYRARCHRQAMRTQADEDRGQERVARRLATDRDGTAGNGAGPEHGGHQVEERWLPWVEQV